MEPLNKVKVKGVSESYRFMRAYYFILGDHGSTVVKVLRYKSEGRWFDPR
jgi:hypothetical protein